MVTANVLEVSGDSTASKYALLGPHRDSRGECLVGYLAVDSLEVTIVASTFERFLWFYVDNISRQVDAAGEDLDDDDIAPSDWPFENPEWMLKQDPGLARWMK